MTQYSRSPFQSAPHFSSEANPALKRLQSHTSKFQSAPHFSSEANLMLGNLGPSSVFQSAPHFSSEANDLEANPTHSPRVSIRASLQQRGERFIAQMRTLKKGFNPRLTSAARRTCSARAWVLKNKVFQSAPHFSSEANEFSSTVSAHVECFNPRLTSAARRTRAYLCGL